MLLKDKTNNIFIHFGIAHSRKEYFVRVCFSLSCQKQDSSKQEPSGTSSGPSSDPEFAKRGHLENTKPLERSGLVEQTVGLMKF